MQQSEEARRYVLDRVIAGDLQVSQAAEILSISERHRRGGEHDRASSAARGSAAPAEYRLARSSRHASSHRDRHELHRRSRTESYSPTRMDATM